MEVNFKMSILKSSVKKMKFTTIFPPQEHSNKIVLWRGKTDLLKKELELLNETNPPKYFWADAVGIICYTLNRHLIRPILKKTPYELYKGRKPNISHLRFFGCKCFILNNGKESLGKFDAKADEAIFLGYSLQSRAYRVFNRRTLCVEEFVYVVCDESNSLIQENALEDEDASFQNKHTTLENEFKDKDLQQSKEITIAAPRDLPKERRTQRDLSMDNIIGEPINMTFA